MDALFDVHTADKEVIESLLKANTKLWRQREEMRLMLESNKESIKRSQNEMFIKSTDGKFYRVEAEQEVSADEVQAKLNECQAEAACLQALVTPEAPAAAPAEQPVAPVEQPAQPAQPEQPVEQSAPADPAAPVAPVADPNAAPAEQPAAPADPNAVPPLQ